MGPAANQPLAPSAKPLAHEDAPVAAVASAPGLLEAQPGVDGQVLVHLLVGVEPYLRQAIRHGLPLREGHELAPEALPWCPGATATLPKNIWSSVGLITSTPSTSPPSANTHTSQARMSAA